MTWLRQRQRRTYHLHCRLCGRPFTTTDRRKRYCVRPHQRLDFSLSRARRADEELIVTPERSVARAVLSTYLRRGYRRMGRKTSTRHARPPYVVGWRRYGVYIIRARGS